MTKSEAGQMGGLITLIKYGNNHYSQIGAKGGRPRQQPASLTPLPLLNKKEERLPNSLRELKKLYKAVKN